jgi:hypothetical protein
VAEVEEVRLRLQVGEVYRFLGLGEGVGKPLPTTMPETRGVAGLWRYPPGDYRFIGLSTAVRFMAGARECGARQEVVYEGLGGRERGLLFHCPVEDFARCFVLKADLDRSPEPPPASPLPEKVAGYIPEEWRRGV